MGCVEGPSKWPHDSRTSRSNPAAVLSPKTIWVVPSSLSGPESVCWLDFCAVHTFLLQMPQETHHRSEERMVYLCQLELPTSDWWVGKSSHRAFCNVAFPGDRHACYRAHPLALPAATHQSVVGLHMGRTSRCVVSQ